MLFGSIEKPETAGPLRVKYFVRLTEFKSSDIQRSMPKEQDN
jgi:hypothetical protein